VVEVAGGVKAGDGLAQGGLEAGEVLVGFGELGAGVAEEVLHAGDFAAHVDRERSAVLPARDTEDVPGGQFSAVGHGLAFHDGKQLMLSRVP